MQSNFARSLELVLDHEGGWADHPKDPGGATMRGVTLATFRDHFGADKTKADLRAITQEQLQHVYRVGYWDALRCDDLPAGVDYAVFDSAVNSGPRRAREWLQQASGRKASAPLDPQEVVKQDSWETINKLLNIRLAFLRGLVAWDTFGRGWRRRIGGVRGAALKMAEQARGAW
jgi:lysozyme family protein